MEEEPAPDSDQGGGEPASDLNIRAGEPSPASEPALDSDHRGAEPASASDHRAGDRALVSDHRGGEPASDQPDGDPALDSDLRGDEPDSESDHPGGEPDSESDHPGGEPAWDSDHRGGEPASDSDRPGGEPALDSDHPGGALDSDHQGGEPASASERPGGDQTQSAESSTCSSPVEAPAARPQARHVRSGSFQRWRMQMQRAWRWGPGGGSGNGRDGEREHAMRTSVNLELLANQKRQWYRIQSKSKDRRQQEEPTSLFEHFFIAGLHSDANVEVIERAFAKRKNWETEVARSETIDLRKIQYQVPMPSLEPQILFKYPPGKQVAMREADIPDFCFPEGVKARLLERTPSMSDLNELVYGQEHLARDDSAFIFSLKVSDNATLYGVCLHVQEIVQKAPGILGAISPLTHSSCKRSQFLVSAPRCYCLLTRVPFFELHYEMLNRIIAQERLDRITQFVSEMTLTESVPQGISEHDQAEENNDFPNSQSNSWMGYAIPVDSVIGITSPSVSISSDRELPPYLCRQLEPHTSENASATEASDISHVQELDGNSRETSGQLDDLSTVTSGSCSDIFERTNGSYEYGQASSDVGTIFSSVSHGLECIKSMGSVDSSVRGAGSDDDDDDLSSKPVVASDEKVMEWSKAHNNEPLQIVCGYHALPLPPRGSEVIFHPLEHLQPINYCRPSVSFLDLGTSGTDLSCPTIVNEVQLAAAEEALALSIWTVATACRVLSLESVLTLITGALLEKQMIVVCPNLGVLSAIVLSLIPMIRPFEWQSLFLPVLPKKMLDFLDAPVPFIVGIQDRPTDIKMKVANLVCVNVYKDQVKGCSLPHLPRHRELISELSPIHARLSCDNFVAKRHPVYKCSQVQVEAAGNFLSVMKCYMESFCSNLRAHTITNVQSDDKVSLLLKDSFVDSFPIRERSFIKLLVDTQLFSVLSDSRLSRYEN